MRFWNAPAEDLLRELDSKGGMLGVPSAPSLAQAAVDGELLRSHREAAWNVMDGGYVAMLLRMVGRNCRRISGLQIVQKLTLPTGKGAVPMQERRILWVVPNGQEAERIANYVASRGFPWGSQFFYEAPYYRTDGEYRDEGAFAKVREVKPDWIVVCIGGGRQEKLGYWLQKEFCGSPAGGTSVAIFPGPEKEENGEAATNDQLSSDNTYNQSPAIICTGAAIAFLSGGQANIPPWADRLYLGWLLRILNNPRSFIPRYFNAAWQFPVALWRFRGEWFAKPEKSGG